MHIALRIILLFGLLGQAAGMVAQCPSSDSLYKHIVAITKANLPSNQERLKRLLAFNEDIKKCPSRVDSIYAYLLRRIGVVYGQLGEYQKAIEYTKQAISVISVNWGKASINPSDLPICYYNLQSYYDATGKEILKRDAIDSCISIDLRIGGNYYYSSYLIRDKIDYLLKRGDYIRSMNYASLVEKLFQNNDTNQLKARCEAIIYHANILIVLKRYAEALDLLNREMPTFRARKEFIGSVYTLIGIVQIYVGSYTESLANFFKSLEFNFRIGHHPGIAATYHWIGFVYAQRLNQPRMALKYYRRGLHYADATDAVPILSDIGKTYANLHIFDSAFHSFQSAFDTIRPGSSENSVIQDVLDAEADEATLNYVTTLLINKANAYLKVFKLNGSRNSLSNALKVYVVADRFLNNLQSRPLELDSKLFWRDNTRELYENAIESSFLDGNTEAAFHFFERSRAAILTAQLNEQSWMPEEEMFKLAELKKEIYQQERLLHEGNNAGTTHLRLQNDILQKKEQLQRTQQEIRSAYPLFYQRFIDTTQITIKDVQQKLLIDHQALVELFHGDSAVYVLSIENQKANLQKIGKASFDELSKSFIGYISNVEQLNSDYDNFLKLSHQLYKLIFPLGPPQPGRIIFSPDGEYLPFEALVTSIKPTVYFIENHAVSHTYSVRYLMHKRGRELKKNGNGNFFGIAPVRFNPAWQLSTLQGSDESLRRIDNYFDGSNNLIAESATRGKFLEQFHSYKVIQLYTHATDSGITGEPMIYFSDSILSLSELIYGRRPVTSLVVLSACQTGLGKLYNGEGVFNFNRGFAAMGVPSSISNLWLIETQATYKLTELFYKHLATGLSADLALQRAKKEFMNEGASRRNQLPYLWAASILVGDSNFAIEEKTFSWKWLFVVIPLLMLASWWIKRRVERNK
jgi:CHAT domain-containing protein